MKVAVLPNVGKGKFLQEVEKKSGQNILECYQCGKCSGICPFSFIMDYPPNQILEMIVHGMEKELLRSKAVQMCIGCGTCEANCPSGFQMYRVMDALRYMAKEKGIISDEKDIPRFNNQFLGTVKKSGRLHEVGLILQDVLANRTNTKPLKYVTLGPKMMLKGVMSISGILPHNISGKDQVARLFNNVEKGGHK